MAWMCCRHTVRFTQTMRSLMYVGGNKLLKVTSTAAWQNMYEICVYRSLAVCELLTLIWTTSTHWHCRELDKNVVFDIDTWQCHNDGSMLRTNWIEIVRSLHHRTCCFYLRLSKQMHISVNTSTMLSRLCCRLTFIPAVWMVIIARKLSKTVYTWCAHKLWCAAMCERNYTLLW